MQQPSNTYGRASPAILPKLPVVMWGVQAEVFCDKLVHMYQTVGRHILKDNL